MKRLLFLFTSLVVTLSFSQEKNEEFLPITIENKEAFLSTKTGEYVFLPHEETNPNELKTTVSGVVYKDISTHVVKKGETLFSIAKNYNLDLNQFMSDNKLENQKLSLGQELKIIIHRLIPSSSPTISYAGEERVVAKLQPGQSPSTLTPPPVNTNKPTTNTPKKATSFTKPMVVPLTNNSEKNEEEETDDVKKAKQELLEAQRKLKKAEEKAKQKNNEQEEVINKTDDNQGVKSPEYHIIQKGDNLYKLAKKYNTTVEALSKLNDIKFNNLKIGQKIKLR